MKRSRFAGTLTAQPQWGGGRVRHTGSSRCKICEVLPYRSQGFTAWVQCPAAPGKGAWVDGTDPSPGETQESCCRQAELTAMTPIAKSDSAEKSFYSSGDAMVARGGGGEPSDLAVTRFRDQKAANSARKLE